MRLHSVFVVMLLGAALGTLILGLLGRAVMAIVSIGAGNDPNLSLYGIILALLLGTFLGAIGGVVLLLIKNVLHFSGTACGALVGILLFILTLVLTLLRGGLSFGGTFVIFVTLAAALLLFAAYGTLLGRFADRMDTS